MGTRPDSREAGKRAARRCRPNRCGRARAPCGTPQGRGCRQTTGHGVLGALTGRFAAQPLGRRTERARRLTREQKLVDLIQAVGAMRAPAVGLHRRRVAAKPAEIVGGTPGLCHHPPSALGTRGPAPLNTPLRGGPAAGQRRGTDVAEGGPGRPGARADDRALRRVRLNERPSGGAHQRHYPGAARERAPSERGFAGVVFSSAGQLQTFEFPGGRVEPEATLGFAATFYGGGTDWDTSPREALRPQVLSPYKQRDVVVITDRLCALSAGSLPSSWRRRSSGSYGCLGSWPRSARTAHGAWASATRSL